MTDITDPSTTAVQAPREPIVRSPMESAVALLQQGVTIEQLQAMMEMQLKFEANEARKAYVVAMAEWKMNPPEIVKQKMVDFPSKGGRTTYMHATLGDVCNAVIESLAQHGFSHRWSTRNAKGEGIYVTCLLTHRLGHSESFEMGPGEPDSSGGKNPIQAIASTQTYFQRYSLLGICGLTSNDMRDNDGRSVGDGADDDKFRLAEWIESVERCETVEDLADTKTRGDAIIRARNDVPAFEAFKKAIQARRMVLDPEYAAKLAAKLAGKQATQEQTEPGSEG